MTRRALLIGQAPCRTGDPSRPLTGAAGRRIAALAGLTTFQYLRRFDRANVFDVYPGKNGKGDRFDAAAAREAALRKAGEDLMIGDRPFVLYIGQNVARAFRHPPAYLAWSLSAAFDGAPAAVLPHPSGINRWWNDPANVRRARRFLRRLAKRTATK